MLLLPAPKPQLLLPQYCHSLWSIGFAGMSPGLWVQLSPELQSKADKVWEEHMAKPPEQRMREYYEGALRGLKMLSGAIESLQQDANVKATEEILRKM